MAAEAYAEVVGTPYGVWKAPVGTTFPTFTTDEDDFDPAWFEFGVNGINNQGSEGVTVNIGSTESNFTPAGLTLPVKGWRTDEPATVQFSYVDLTVETLSAILDDASITTVAATTGHAGGKSISMIRGVQLSYFALLVRGLSPYDDGSGLVAQWQFARVAQTGAQAAKFQKGTPAELACEFTIFGTVTGDDPAIYTAETAPVS